MSPAGLCGLLLCALLALSFAALFIGYVPMSISDVGVALLSSGDTADAIIVREIRLPRVLLAWCVGGSLGVAGAALQGLLRNPLAEPGLLGISSSASLGAVIAVYFGLTTFSDWLLPVSAMLGAALATAVLYALARRSPSNLTLILAGIALSSLAAALTSLALNLSPNPYDVNDIVLWLLGSLSERSFNDLGIALPFIAAGMALLLGCARPLATLTLGEETAESLGVDLARLRGLIIVGTALCVGASVAVAGAIGFVGLVVPHMLRPLVGYRADQLLLPSAIGGALLLLLADTALRLLNGSQELMLGVMTSLIGAPFFLWLVVRSRHYRT
ncbi:MAG: iron ABC transporter permease [Gammaproteobacteria bacterium]|nr:iron ABC transporter permease [Gammaproteobacteria bacterium]